MITIQLLKRNLVKTILLSQRNMAKTLLDMKTSALFDPFNSRELAIMSSLNRYAKARLEMIVSSDEKALLDVTNVDINENINYVWMHYNRNVACPIPVMFPNVVAPTWQLVYDHGQLVSVSPIQFIQLKCGFQSLLKRFPRNVPPNFANVTLSMIVSPANRAASRFISGTMAWIVVMRDCFHIEQLRSFLIQHPTVWRSEGNSKHPPPSEFKDRFDIPTFGPLGILIGRFIINFFCSYSLW